MFTFTSHSNGMTIETLGLDKIHHEIAVKMIKGDKMRIGNYQIKEIDADMLDSWIDVAHEDGDEESEAFYAKAQLNDADVYAFSDASFPQTLGDVAVYFV